MSRLSKKLRIVLHCSAGFTLIPAIEKYWYNTLKWKNPGYHIIIYQDGTKWYVTKNGKYSTDVNEFYPELVTNGVQGFNQDSLHVCYIGGVELVNGVYKAKDTRTDAQKASIIDSIVLLFDLVNKQNGEIIDILGHRDFSKDKNGNGVIDTWERIKECPSFDAKKEYFWIIAHKGKIKLPNT